MSRADRTNLTGADALPPPLDDRPSPAQMITDLAHVLVGDDDCRTCMSAAVKLIAPTLRADAVLVLADPPGYDGQVLSAASAASPAARESAATITQALVAVRGDDGGRALPPERAGERLAEVVRPCPGQQIIVSPVPGDPGLVGVLACSRPADAAAFDDADRGDLAAAAGVMGLLLRISRQRWEQERLSRRWQEAFDSAPVGMGVLDATGCIALVNPRAEQIFGRSAEQLAGVNWREVTHPDDLEAESRHLADVLLRRVPRMDHTKRVLRPDGEARWVQTSTVIRAPAEDEPAEYFTQLLDITDQRAAEGEAHRFAALVESSVNFIGLAGLDGRLTYLNPAGRRLVGLAEDVDVTGLVTSDFAVPESVEAGARERLLREGRVFSTLQLRHWDGGEPISVASNAFLLTDRDTEAPIGLATICRDIRGEIESRQALERVSEQRRQLLQEVVTAEENERGRLAEVLHDEPMQLVAAIGLRLRALAGAEAPTGELGTVIDLVDRAGHSLRAVLSDLDVGPADESFAAMIAEVAPRLCPGVVVTVEGDPGPLPDAAALVLARAVRETLTNVGRHAHARSVSIGFDRDERGLAVRVRDDGVGMGRVPERRGHLGLRTLTARIEALGGSCRAGDDERGGSVVQLWLPATALDLS